MVLRGRIYLFALFASLFAALVLIGSMAGGSRAQEAITPPSELHAYYNMKWEMVPGDGDPIEIVTSYTHSSCMYDPGTQYIRLSAKQPSFYDTLEDNNNIGASCANITKTVTWSISNFTSEAPRVCTLEFNHTKKHGWKTWFSTTCDLWDENVSVLATCNGVDCLGVPYAGTSTIDLSVTLKRNLQPNLPNNVGAFSSPSNGAQLYSISQFSGSSSVTGGQVWLGLNGKRFEASMQSGGNWVYNPSDPDFNTTGSHTVTLHDAASGGNKLAERTYTIIEVTPPEPVHVDSGGFTAPSNGARLQSISQFSGTSDVSGGKVWLELNGDRFEASMQSGGNWVYSPSNPDFNKAGSHRVTLHNAASGGRELASLDYTITDKGAIREPSAGAELLSISQFSGTSDVAGGKVWLELGGRRYQASMLSGGNWIYKPSDPAFSSVGPHTVTLYNAASGGDNLDSRSYYMGKPMAITAPAANVVIDSKPGGTVPISGTGFPGVSYSLSLDKTNGISIDDTKVVPDQNGNWSRQIRIAGDAAQKVTGWYLEATLTRTGGRAQLDAATVLADEPPVKKKFAIELENVCRINNREYRGSSQTITMAPGPVRIEGLTMEQSVVSLAQIIAWDDGLKSDTRAHDQYQDGFWSFEGDGSEPQINLQIGDYPFQITTRPRVEGFIGADNLICSGTIVVR
jgi:hypothetical protein